MTKTVLFEVLAGRCPIKGDTILDDISSPGSGAQRAQNFNFINWNLFDTWCFLRQIYPLVSL
jgi:hypothetical protein